MKTMANGFAKITSRTALMTFCLGALLAMTACSTLQRSGASGYQARESRGDSERALSPDRYSDDGTMPSPSRLRAAEDRLEGKREREQYFKNKPYLKNDRERFELLSLGSYEERARWLEARGIFGPATPHAPEIQALVDINDITVGMTKQAVRDSWGEPELVEVAGNPLYGNERWAYSEQLPSTDGFQTEKRTIYFEGGRVIGWNKR